MREVESVEVEDVGVVPTDLHKVGSPRRMHSGWMQLLGEQELLQLVLGRPLPTSRCLMVHAREVVGVRLVPNKYKNLLQHYF